MEDNVTIQSDILLEMLDLMKKESFSAMRKKLLLSIPLNFYKEGSGLWWERSELEADIDIKKGRVSKKYDNVGQMIKDLTS